MFSGGIKVSGMKWVNKPTDVFRTLSVCITEISPNFQVKKLGEITVFYAVCQISKK